MSTKKDTRKSTEFDFSLKSAKAFVGSYEAEVSVRKIANRCLNIDFSSSPSQTFGRSFLRGLAPNALFDDISSEISDKPVVLRPPNGTTSDALASDWKSIGRDFSVVIERHGKRNDSAR